MFRGRRVSGASRFRGVAFQGRHYFCFSFSLSVLYTIAIALTCFGSSEQKKSGIVQVTILTSTENSFKGIQNAFITSSAV